MLTGTTAEEAVPMEQSSRETVERVPIRGGTPQIMLHLPPRSSTPYTPREPAEPAVREPDPEPKPKKQRQTQKQKPTPQPSRPSQVGVDPPLVVSVLQHCLVKRVNIRIRLKGL